MLAPMPAIPEGFSPHFRESPLTEPWKPIYSRVNEKSVSLAILADKQHTNSRGLVHGGLIASLADNAMGLSCAVQLDKGVGLVTVSLSLNFVGAAKLGEWLFFDTQLTEIKRRLAFTQATMHSDGKTIALANATFNVIRYS